METVVAHGCTGATGRCRAVARRSWRDWFAPAGLLHISRTTTFGNVVIVLFFVAQALDGGLTYIGVQVFGPTIEANPLLAWLMAAVGEGPALAGAKLAAMGFGIILHLASVHRVVALLTALYVSAAVLPWTALLLVAGQLR
jgi:Domain of unknown function (DUF5658)